MSLENQRFEDVSPIVFNGYFSHCHLAVFGGSEPKVPREAGWIMLDSEKKSSSSHYTEGLSPQDDRCEDMLLLAGLQVEY